MQKMIHPSGILEFPGTLDPTNIITGGENVIDHLKKMMASTGNTLRFHPKIVLYDGKHAIIHWFATAFIPKIGNYINRGCSWLTLENGLCTGQLDFLDNDLFVSYFKNPDPAKCKMLSDKLRKIAPKNAGVFYDK
jgi:hypothetical protein